MTQNRIRLLHIESKAFFISFFFFSISISIIFYIFQIVYYALSREQQISFREKSQITQASFHTKTRRFSYIGRALLIIESVSGTTFTTSDVVSFCLVAVCTHRKVNENNCVENGWNSCNCTILTLLPFGVVSREFVGPRLSWFTNVQQTSVLFMRVCIDFFNTVISNPKHIIHNNAEQTASATIQIDCIVFGEHEQY